MPCRSSHLLGPTLSAAPGFLSFTQFSCEPAPPSRQVEDMNASDLSSTPDTELIAQLHPSHFEKCDSNFDSCSVASDGCVYFTLCSHDIDTHARIYRQGPTGEPTCLGDLGTIVGEAGAKSVPQGESHSPYYEHEGTLYLATHCGYYKPSSNKEEPGEAPPGYTTYPGGHFLSYDMKAGQFSKLAQAPAGEGFMTLSMDRGRGRLYGLTWPRSYFMYYDLETKEMVNLGPVSGEGEIGTGETYYCLCRSLGIDPRDGSVYFTNPDGEIYRFSHAENRIEGTGVSLRRDIFGHWEIHEPGHQGYNWRKAHWHAGDERFYAVHGKSGFLFSFDPQAGQVDIIERLAADELRRNGRYEPFRYGYLSFEVGPDGDTIYYLTGTYGLEAEDGRKVEETLHLVTYGLRTGKYLDHGVLRLDDGRYPTMTQSIAVHPNGRIYTAPWIEKPGAAPSAGGRAPHQVELISFEDPLRA